MANDFSGISSLKLQRVEWAHETSLKVHAQAECIIVAILNSLEEGLCSIMFHLPGMQKEEKRLKVICHSDYNHSSREMVTLTAKKTKQKKKLIFNTQVGYLKK